MTYNLHFTKWDYDLEFGWRRYVTKTVTKQKQESTKYGK
jgi:hypothetical protein